MFYTALLSQLAALFSILKSSQSSYFINPKDKNIILNIDVNIFNIIMNALPI